jgi:hypothetical protein
VLDAAPVGFIEVGPEGSRFEAIPDPAAMAQAVRTVAGAITGVVGVIAAARALRGVRSRGRVAGLLRRGQG